MPPAPFPLLRLPPEIRLLVYAAYFADLTRPAAHTQPHNDHIRFLHVSRAVYYEAGALFRTYVSFRHERQIDNFLRDPDAHNMSAVLWADVANDGRTVVTSPRVETPLSRLYLVLQRMESLRCVRVFDCRQGIPAPASKKFIRLSFERAMFPGAPPSKLKAYALHLDSTTTASLFDKIPSDRLETLRISGNAKMRAGLKFPALRHLALHGVTGIDLDRRPLHENIIGCELESFAYSMGERMAFEIRDATLKSLIGGIGKHLRKLVLLDCSRVSSEALMVCLGELPDLEYFALALVTVSELRYDFVASLSSKLLILKLDIRNAWFASPLPDEEQRICDSTETNFLRRRPSPDELQIRVRDTHWTEDGREGRWRDLSVTRGIRLLIGPWTANEEV